MAFNVVAQLQLQGPNNLQQIKNSLNSQLGGINASINLVVNPSSVASINNLARQINQLKQDIASVSKTNITVNTNPGALNNLNNTLNNVRNNSRSAASATKEISGELNNAAASAENFGKAAGLAARRYSAFLLSGGAIVAIVQGFKEATVQAVLFEREMVRLNQVGAGTSDQIRAIKDEITRLSTGLGVSSIELAKASNTLAQAGLNARDTAKALEALAQAALSPNFGNMSDTVEGVIAVMQQFKIEAGGVQGALSSMNAVASAFAVESRDLIEAVKRSGGTFKSTGGDLNEFLALFTSVRSTTRESADSIATGLRTIFARLQRKDTVEALQALGVNLRYTRQEAEQLGNLKLQDQFVGAFESVKRLNEALSTVAPTDPRYSAVIEQLGGYRQISRVLPLIQELTTSQKAYNVALFGTNSLQTAAGQAQESTIVKLEKLREQFLALFRTVTESRGFQVLVDQLTVLGGALTQVAGVLTPLIPLLATLATVKIGQQIGNIFSGLGTGLQGGAQQSRGVVRRNGGGFVPGSGDFDTVPAMLTPGEYVIRKDAVRAIGVDNLEALNGYNKGGRVRRYASGGSVSKTTLDEIRALVLSTNENDPAQKSRLNERITALTGLGGKGSGASGSAQVRELIRALGGYEKEFNQAKQKGVGVNELLVPFTNDILGVLTTGAVSESGVRFVSDAYTGEKTSQDVQQKFRTRGIERVRGGVTSHILSRDSRKQFTDQYYRRINAALSLLFPQGSGIQAQLDDSQKRTVAGYLFEGFVGNLTGLKPAGGETNFDFPGNFGSNPKSAEFSKYVYPPIKPGELLDAKFVGEGNKRNTSVLRKYISLTNKSGALDAKLANYPIYKNPQRKNAGGGILGIGNKVPALLTPGEYVMSADTVNKHGTAFMDGLNAQRFATGGRVGLRSGQSLGQISVSGDRPTTEGALDLNKVPFNSLFKQTLARYTARTFNSKATREDKAAVEAYVSQLTSGVEAVAPVSTLTLKNKNLFQTEKLKNRVDSGISSSIYEEVGSYPTSKPSRDPQFNKIISGFILESLVSAYSGIEQSGGSSPLDFRKIDRNKLQNLRPYLNNSEFIPNNIDTKRTSVAPRVIIEKGVNANLFDPNPLLAKIQNDKVRSLPSGGKLGGRNISDVGFSAIFSGRLAGIKRSSVDGTFIGRNKGGMIPSLLTPGEYVVPSSTVKRFGSSFFDGVNAKRFATGGRTGSFTLGDIRGGALNNTFTQSQIDDLLKNIENLASTLNQKVTDGTRVLLRSGVGNIAGPGTPLVRTIESASPRINTFASTASELRNNLALTGYSTKQIDTIIQRVSDSLSKLPPELAKTARFMTEYTFENGRLTSRLRTIVDKDLSKNIKGLPSGGPIGGAGSSGGGGVGAIADALTGAETPAATGRFGRFRNFLSQRGSTIAIAGGVAANLGIESFAKDALQNRFGSIENAALLGTREQGSAVRGAGISGALTGATFGGAIAAGVAPLAGPFAPLVLAAGVAGGAIYGFIDATRQAEKDIRQNKLNKALTDLGDRFQRISDSPIGFEDASKSIQQLNQSRQLITQRVREENTSTFGGLDSKAFAVALDKATRESLGNLAPQMAAILNRSFEEAARSRPGASVGDINQQVQQGNFGLNRVILQSLAQSEGTTIQAIMDRFKKSVLSVQREQFIREANNRIIPENDRLFNAFSRLSDIVDKASQSAELFSRKMDLAEAAIEGRISGNFTGTIRPQDTGFTGAFGNEGRQFGGSLNALRSVNDILPSILSQTLQSGQLEGQGLGNSLSENLAKALTGSDLKNITGPIRQFIETVGTNLAKLDPEELFRSRADVGKLAEDLTKDLAPLQEAARNIARKLEENANSYAQALAKYAALQDKVNEELGKADELRLDLTKFQINRFGEATFRSNATSNLPLDVLNKPFEQRQARLLGGVANDPVIIEREIKARQAQIESAKDAADADIRAGKASSDNVKKFIELQDEANGLQKALKNLTDASARTANAQQKLADLQNERRAREQLGERFLTGDFEERFKLIQGRALIGQAVGAGGNVSLANPALNRRLFEALNAFAEIKLPEFGGRTGNDIRSFILERSGAGFTPQEKAQESALKNAIEQGMAVAVRAQEAYSTIVKDSSDKFATALEQYQNKFSSEITKLIDQERIRAERATSGRLERDRQDLERKVGFVNQAATGGLTEENLGQLRQGGALRKAAEDAATASARVEGLRQQLGVAETQGRNLQLGGSDISDVIAGLRQLGVSGPAGSDFDPAKIAADLFKTGQIDSIVKSGTNRQFFKTREEAERAGGTNIGVQAPSFTSGKAAGFLADITDKNAINKQIADLVRRQAIEALNGQIRIGVGDQLNARDRLRAGGVNNQGISFIESGQGFRSPEFVKFLDENTIPKIRAFGEELDKITTQIRERQISGVDPTFIGPPVQRANGGSIFSSSAVVPNIPSRRDFGKVGTDTVPALLTPGEYVINKRQAQNNMALLQAINSGNGPVRFADGGPVDPFMGARFQYAKILLSQRYGLLNRSGDPEGARKLKELIDHSDDANPQDQLYFINQLTDAEKNIVEQRIRDTQGLELAINSTNTEQLRIKYLSILPIINNQKARLNTHVRTILDPALRKTKDEGLKAQINNQKDLVGNALNWLGGFPTDKKAVYNLGRLELSELIRKAYTGADAPNKRYIENIGGSQAPVDKDKFKIIGQQNKGFNPVVTAANGGVIPGVGNGDTVRALLTPGEFVINKRAAQAIGYDNLAAMQKFAAGGPVGGNIGGADLTALTNLTPALIAFNDQSRGLISAFNGFGPVANSLVDALGRIPSSISLEGRYEVSVVFNGAEALARMEPTIREWITEETQTALNRFVSDKLPEVNR